MALQDLLLGRAFLGHLNADEPTEVLLDWLQSLGARSSFVDEVDAALASWVRRSWGRPVLPFPGASGGVIATAWCRAADLVAFEPGLKRSALVLRSFVLEGHSFLASLSEGRARDPEGRVWLAVARHQEDRSLRDHWWRLCSLPPDVPWYHGFYGIHGLRELPAEKPERAGTFPAEVAEGLARLADALAGRVDEGWLTSNTAREEFRRTAELTMAAYAGEERWISFWRHTLQKRRVRSERAKSWIQDLFPRELKKEIRPAPGARSRWLEPDPAWNRQAQEIAARLGRRDWSALEPARTLLLEQGCFAEATGDSYNVVHSACNFAGKVREARPELALEWAEMARSFDPWNAYAWTTSAATLLTLRRKEEGVRRALGAVRRFPYDVVARTGLAEVLKDQGRLEEAESVYRETKERFPDNVVARTGLAEVLKDQGRLEEAESVYRETKERFPDDVVARNGLAEVLKGQGRLEEAESLYRETKERFPDNVVARNGLAEVLKGQGRLEEAESLYRETTQRFPWDVVARNGLAAVLKAEGKTAEAEVLQRQTASEHSVEGVTESPERERRQDLTVSSHGGPFPERAEAEAEEAEPRSTVSYEPLARNLSRSEVAEPRTEYGSKAAPFRGQDVEVLLQDSYLLRRWGGSSTSLFLLRDRARLVLDQIVVAGSGDSEAVGELALVEIDQGDLDQVLRLLREAAKRFPGSARVRYALARAERAAAERRRHLDPDKPESPVLPWRGLARLDSRYKPLQHLGEGRTWLVQVDGAFVAEHARNCLGALGFWLREQDRIAEEALHDRSLSDATAFTRWWAGEVQKHVFGKRPVKGYEDVGELASIQERIGVHAAVLNQLEEDWVGQWARA